ncbi:MAG: hypothetical protein RSH24_11390 [Flavobacterium sp.]
MKAEEIIKKLSTTKKNKIAKLTVRELEQQADGSYIAFVDDAAESFDVSLLLKESQITKHTCDCTVPEAFCIHKTALLLNLTEAHTGNVSSKPSRAKKAPKQSQAQQILQSLSLPQVSNWLQNYFNKNKEAEMLFLLDFSPKTITFQVDEIDDIVQKAFVAVMIKRKKIELNELKKIILYLEQSLQPVFQYMQSLIAQQTAYFILEAINKSINGMYSKYRVPGTRLQKYQGQIIDKYTLMLNNLQDTVLWKIQADFLLQTCFELDFGKRLVVAVIADAYKNGNTEQKTYLSSHISDYFIQLESKHLKLPREAEEVLLQIVIEGGDLKKCHTYFSIHPYENSFNVMLLQALKDIDPDRALQYCNRAVKQNTKAEYNIPYLKIMEYIMEMNNMPQKQLAQVRRDLFAIDPYYER